MGARRSRSKKLSLMGMGILLAVSLAFSMPGCGQKGARDDTAVSGSQPDEGQTVEVVSPPPAGDMYHGVFPGGVTGEEDDITPASLSSYEQTAGKPAAWVYFSHNWYRDRGFPAQTATWIRDAGSVPYIRLMLRSSAEFGVAEPTFTLERITNGEFDTDLRAWARSASDFGSPLIAEYGTEVNGEWFRWNGIWNGGAVGPERFREAYRHIITIAREAGANNILWVFHANNRDDPDEPWNRLENYYPGDEWIDWIGVSVYGAQTPREEDTGSFRESMDAIYPRLTSLNPGKPIVLLEFGVTSGNPGVDQAAWAKGALEDITSSRWARLMGFSWWNEAWENDDNPLHNTDMRVQDNAALAEVFRGLVGRQDNVLGRAILTERQISP